jgi:tRNA/tmRNA/rRNA uracil-C5-methylase (TrmA/RlmC/RlmD family)
MTTQQVDYPNGFMKYKTKEEAEFANRQRAKERYRAKKDRILQQQRERYHQNKELSQNFVQVQQQLLTYQQQLMFYQQQLINQTNTITPGWPDRIQQNITTPNFILEIVNE